MTKKTTYHSTDQSMTITVRFTAERFRGYDDRDDYEAYSAKVEAEYLANVYEHVLGASVMVGISEYVGPNGPRSPSFNIWRDNGEGWSGNMDHTIKRYNGWRGTSDDWAFYGYGLRVLESITVTGQRSKKIVFKFGKNLKRED